MQLLQIQNRPSYVSYLVPQKPVISWATFFTRNFDSEKKKNPILTSDHWKNSFPCGFKTDNHSSINYKLPLYILEATLGSFLPSVLVTFSYYYDQIPGKSTLRKEGLTVQSIVAERSHIASTDREKC